MLDPKTSKIACRVGTLDSLVVYKAVFQHVSSEYILFEILVAKYTDCRRKWGQSRCCTLVEYKRSLNISSLSSSSFVATLQTMSSRTPFIKAEWVSVGKKWNDIPPRVRRAAKQDFLIPNAIRAKVLPPPGNSVKQMLEFTLPSYTISIGTRSPESFFSRNSPDTISDFSIITY